MAIKNVRKIPTTYKAVQWTGTKQDASDILGLFDEFGVDGYTYFSDDYQYAEITVNSAKLKDQYRLLYEGQWVVVSSKGKVEILSADEYTEKYEDND